MTKTLLLGGIAKISVTKQTIGVSPSGKAHGFGPCIRGFESLHPSQEEFFALFATMRQPRLRRSLARSV